MCRTYDTTSHTRFERICHKACKRGAGGQNTWGTDWLGVPLVKRLVMGATVKRVGADNV